MRTIRLIRVVDRPGSCGPRNGQWALQGALRRRAPAWLTIGGTPRPGEVPWFWSWQDRQLAARWAAAGRPFVVGPNVLFSSSRRPCAVPAERAICQAASCRLMFTESAWYRELIEAQRGPANRAPIVLWPYPIVPRPGGPLPAQYDLLIYLKGDWPPALIEQLRRELPRSRVIRYGQYRREDLHAAARRSRCCLYLSQDDRGPLALAEILLAGCPAVGIPRGAPFVRPHETGVLLAGFFDTESCFEAVRRCHRLDRREVAAVAAEQFDTDRIVETVLRALDAVASNDSAPQSSGGSR